MFFLSQLKEHLPINCQLGIGSKDILQDYRSKLHDEVNLRPHTLMAHSLFRFSYRLSVKQEPKE